MPYTCICCCLNSFAPLPPDTPLPSVPLLLGPSLGHGSVLQLWGHSQAKALTDHRVPEQLARDYAFDLVIMVPLEAHNSMCGAETAKQQCNASDILTEVQFARGVAAFEEANMSLMLYTSIMHVGHSPVWESGNLTLAHPEWMVMPFRAGESACVDV